MGINPNDNHPLENDTYNWDDCPPEARLTEIHIVPEAGGGYTVKNQNGAWITDAETLEDAIAESTEFAQAHGVTFLHLHIDLAA